MTNWQLQQTIAGLALQDNNSKTELCINFSDKKLNYRRQHTSLKQETLTRAAGLKAHTNPILLDATAGLGRDAFIIASFGFKIYLLERNPIIHALLDDALKRGLSDENISQIIQRMELIHTNSINFLQEPTVKPDIIFIDPMFPARNKSALPQKSMQIFQEIIGKDSDEDQLLDQALACATRRVVVKRPRLAQPIIAKYPPDFSLAGKSSRFDVYLTRKSK